MSKQVKIAAESLEAALATLADTFGKPIRDLGATINSTPALVIGPPAVEWQASVGYPTHARFIVYVINSLGELVFEQFWEYVEQVAHAIDELTPHAVIRADPSVFTNGTTDLPSYEITVEAALI